jgi:hypothetical protein
MFVCAGGEIQIIEIHVPSHPMFLHFLEWMTSQTFVEEFALLLWVLAVADLEEIFGGAKHLNGGFCLANTYNFKDFHINI